MSPSTDKRKPNNLSISILVVSLVVLVLATWFVFNQNVASTARIPLSPTPPTTVIFPSKTTAAPPPSTGNAGRPPTAVPSCGNDRKEEDDDVDEEHEVVTPEGCDLFAGRWVYDDVGHPLYREDDCDFLSSQMSCISNGRADDTYQKWRWQPHACSLPRFNATRLLTRLRGRRLLFVGDSLHRNQWESMVCLVQSVIPPGRKSLHGNGSLTIFRAEDYNATVEFFWAPFLVESNSDSPDSHSIRDRIITNDSMCHRGLQWVGADYLVFNTYIWWMSTDTMKILPTNNASSSSPPTSVERTIAYRQALRTWGAWVDRNVDPARTSVFFSAMSPVHLRSADWDNPDGIRCANETCPILNASRPPNVGTDKRLWTVAADVVGKMAVPVSFLNITELSENRKDAHTSIYTTRQGRLLTPEQRAHPAAYADCIHWCLPGLPDTWNELLYAKIMSIPPPLHP